MFFCEVIAIQADTNGSEEHTDSVFRASALGSTCSSDSGYNLTSTCSGKLL
jgi:hypothetical protein